MISALFQLHSLFSSALRIASPFVRGNELIDGWNGRAPKTNTPLRHLSLPLVCAVLCLSFVSPPSSRLTPSLYPPFLYTSKRLITFLLHSLSKGR